MEYTIQAKPTKYNGRLYRSRLEARWSAFFDLCKWKHEYEPFDLPGWSPDFLIKDKTLVEIKPNKSFFDYKKYDQYKPNYRIELLTGDFTESPYHMAGHYDDDLKTEVWYDDLWIEAGNKVMFLNPGEE
jgi:hypothetical protein